MLIEVIAPAGAGTSTILRRAMQARTDQDPEWLGPRDIDRAFASVPTPRRYIALDDPETARFNHWLLRTIANSAMQAAEKVTVSASAARAEYLRQAIRGCTLEVPVVHDNLSLSTALRALPFSPDLETVAARYFRRTPVPDAVVSLQVDSGALTERIKGRRRLPPVYAGLIEPEWIEVAARARTVQDVAQQILCEREVPIFELDATAPVKESAGALDGWLRDVSGERTHAQTDELWQRLLSTSAAPAQQTGKHAESQPLIPATAFRTRRFSVLSHQAHRDAVDVIKDFQLTPAAVSGKSVVDLRSGAGALLLQLTNLGIAAGYGIERDPGKIDLAWAIAAESRLDQVVFRFGRLEDLRPEDVGSFDVVLCLGPQHDGTESTRLFELLGRVTKRQLCFEPRPDEDLAAVSEGLLAAGFATVEPLTADAAARNSGRGLIARK